MASSRLQCHQKKYAGFAVYGVRNVREKITIDGSAANEAAIKSSKAAHGTAIAIRKVKYLNNIVEQRHRGVKRITRPMLGFKAFDAAQSTLVGIELMHMIKKRQLRGEEGNEGLCKAASVVWTAPVRLAADGAKDAVLLEHKVE